MISSGRIFTLIFNCFSDALEQLYHLLIVLYGALSELAHITHEEKPDEHAENQNREQRGDEIFGKRRGIENYWLGLSRRQKRQNDDKCDYEGSRFFVHSCFNLGI